MSRSTRPIDHARKGQSSVEFVILFGFVMLLFVVFFILIQNNSFSAMQAQKEARVNELQSLVVSEFDLAGKASSGYQRTFNIPDMIDGVNYSIQLVDGEELVVMFEKIESVKFLTMPVKGNISKGDNHISKPEGMILVYPLP